MDSLTQIVLGAAVGETVLGKKVGYKAILWGAIAGTIPDLDVLFGLFVDDLTLLNFHRGISHSIVFCFLFAPILGWLISKIHSKNSATWKDWSKLAFWTLFTHPLLDCFTTWGTQLFWPLNFRVAFHSIFVVDFLYTIPFLICVVWAMFKPKTSAIRRKINYFGLTISSIYLLFTLVNKHFINQVFEQAFEKQNLEIIDYSTRPMPLNNILWTANAKSKDGYYLGYYSWFDETENIKFLYFEKNEKLLGDLINHPKMKKLLFLTQDYFTVENTPNGFKINDLRFGLMDPENGKDFVFVYLIKVSENEILEIKQVRNTAEQSGNAKESLTKLWDRILGKKYF